GPELLWSTRAAYPLVLWQRDGVPSFCLEGTAITAGAAITWLRDGLGILESPKESAALAASVPDAGGAWAIPAFQGLGTPYMEAGARAVLGGLSRATTRAHVVRAMLEGIAWRCREVYEALRADSPHAAPAALRADGGAAQNDVLLQLQADALGLPVERPAVIERAHVLFRDYLGVALGGSNVESSVVLRRALRALAFTGTATVLGAADRLPAAQAALANGAAAHTLEMDDTYQQGSIHLGA